MTEKTAPGAEAPKKAQRFPVKLLKPHTHAGKELEAGATIQVTERQRVFLAESEVIAPEAK